MSLRKAIESYIEKKREEVETLGEECENCNTDDMAEECGWCDGTEEVLDFLEETLEKYEE